MVRVTRKKTGHLIEITRDDGTKDVSWDWKQLEADVRAACSAYEATNKSKNPSVNGHSDAHEGNPKKAVVKNPAAKKPATKKAPVKKSAAKKKKETK